ncbi:MAG: stage IV sporulation protein A [Oscillospiraceae bacterium]
MEGKLYEDIAQRTGGAVLVGVVGPVRTGKSTFIKRFMETLVIPNIENVYMRERARDELPQSGSGKTIMTAEPKFIPEEAVEVTLDSGVSFKVRLIDCVGYMVNGAMGQFEEGAERMVTTPWYDHEISIAQAAEEGTYKVISDHSTIGLVVTTDGTVCDIPREAYLPAEERVVSELKSIGKPFVVLLNTVRPKGADAIALANELSEKYGVPVIPVSCLEMEEKDIVEIMTAVLGEFPVTELSVFLPPWVDALNAEHELKKALYERVKAAAAGMQTIRDVSRVAACLSEDEMIQEVRIRELSMGTGGAAIVVELPRSMYYETISHATGLEIHDDGELMSLLTELAAARSEYERVGAAMAEVREKGYGIVMPTRDEMTLEEPEIVSQNGRYSVRLKASAPSIHMIKANIVTEVSPALGGEKASEEIINFLLQGFEGDVNRIWESNIFGKSLYDIAGEGLATKIKRMPEDARGKLQETLQRIINEGSGGLICIIL